MPRATINGTGIYYEVDGEGLPCLVLHGGLGLDHTLYRRTLAPLADTARLVYPDHRGNGRSARPARETITMPQLADDAVGLAGELGLDRFAVLGHSYGGFVAQELVLRHPDRVAALALVATTPGQPGTDEDVTRYEGPPPPPGFLEAIAKPPDSDEDMAERFFPTFLPFYFHHLGLAEVAPLVDGTVFSADAMARGFEILAGWSSVDRLASISCPVLVVFGADDVITAAPQGRRIADHLPHAELHVLDECGHFPWVEQPDSFFPIVRDWIAKVVPS